MFLTVYFFYWLGILLSICLSKVSRLRVFAEFYFLLECVRFAWVVLLLCAEATPAFLEERQSTCLGA
jgi:hypothetical protein